MLFRSNLYFSLKYENIIFLSLVAALIHSREAKLSFLFASVSVSATMTKSFSYCIEVISALFGVYAPSLPWIM